jgi:hypothetical protein
MRRYGEPCKDQEPLLPLEFCSDCIIATRGYDFWEGQACSGFTRITARQIAQPPRGDLCHQAPTPAVARKPLVSYRINRQLMEWTGRAPGGAKLQFRITGNHERDIP